MTTRHAASFVILFCVVLRCLTQEAPRRQESSTLKVEATAVVVDVIVTDRKGHHVPGLTVSDFKLFENDSPQTIESFTQPTLRTGPQGVENGSAEPAALAPSVDGPEGPAPAKQTWTPQLITVVLDLGDLHPENLMRTCAAAGKFAEKTIAEGNLIAIYWVDSSLHLGVPFTRDRKRALDVLESLNTRVPSGRFTALERERMQDELNEMKNESVAMPTNPGMGGSPQPDPAVQAMEQARNMVRSLITTGNALQARTVFVALRALALTYRALPGRKTVVVFSEGFLHALDGGREIEAVIDATNRSNVAIYVVDAAGMALGGLDGQDPMSVKRRTYDTQFGPDIGEGPKGRVAGGLGEFDYLQTFGI